jgi:hypothetical protein
MTEPNDPSSLEAEIAQLRGLDLNGLRARWHSMNGRKAPPHLPRHLLFRILAYRLQADRLGDLDRATQQFLQRIGTERDKSRNNFSIAIKPAAELRPGTVLVREWKGAPHHVTVLANGFRWNERTYRSLSEVACAITGTRWSGPRFFGLQPRTSDDGRRR